MSLVTPYVPDAMEGGIFLLFCGSRQKPAQNATEVAKDTTSIALLKTKNLAVAVNFKNYPCHLSV
jgi:hypothetical protein